MRWALLDHLDVMKSPDFRSEGISSYALRNFASRPKSIGKCDDEVFPQLDRTKSLTSRLHMLESHGGNTFGRALTRG